MVIERAIEDESPSTFERANMNKTPRDHERAHVDQDTHGGRASQDARDTPAR